MFYFDEDRRDVANRHTNIIAHLEMLCQRIGEVHVRLNAFASKLEDMDAKLDYVLGFAKAKVAPTMRPARKRKEKA
jgi:hypothetical protein